MQTNLSQDKSGIFSFIKPIPRLPKRELGNLTKFNSAGVKESGEFFILGGPNERPLF